MEQMLSTNIREKSYLRSIGVIMDMIAEGKLQYGDRLYKEQELAEIEFLLTCFSLGTEGE